MKNHQCSNCPIRKQYDNKPKSILGRFWRWHINICPGWKAYFKSLNEEGQNQLRQKYNFTKYNQ